MSKATPETKLFERLLQEYSQAKNYREKKIEARWQENVGLVWPRFAEYGNDTTWSDERYDSTATEAVSLLGDAMFGNMCGPSSNWFKYEFADPAVAKDKEWLRKAERLTERMVDVFRRSTFYDVAAEWLQTCAALANATMDIQEDMAEARIVCRVDQPRGIYLATNSLGRVDTIYQRVWMTVDQAVDKWGEEKLDPGLRRAYSQTPSSEVYEFLNVIKRRKDGDPAAMIAARMPVASYWLRLGDPRRVIIEESGYRVFPKPTWRWSTRGADPYGWGPTDDNMPDIRSLNSMAKSYMLAGQKAADPPAFLPEEGRRHNLDPGARNYTADPNRKAYYMETSSGFRFNDKLFDQMRDRVRQGYKVNHFLMLIQRQQGEMTAREVLERKKEMVTVTGSVVGKAETEGFDATHQRMLQIEIDAGRLQDIFPPETPIPSMRVTYLGPLSQLQREVQAQEGIIGAVEMAVPIIQLFPQTVHKIKPAILMDKILRSKQFPEDAIASDKEYAEKLAELAKQAEVARANVLKEQLAKGTDPNVEPQPGSPAAALVGRGA